ncbi:CCA tRNA nucleotidyltransferase [Bdellovibrio sp. HCB337]|uniref:CCA tRNA nucleotidyltransferase n=1 Tax=Bdellovibrio sp. HCB337 TaxID=3394358 RepID=UPI0039A508CA
MNLTTRPQLHEDWIDPYAREIVRILQDEGFETYLVGGCVRDLLAGIHPKDFDIATNAHPNQVRRKIPHAYVIGKRFRLVLVRRGDQQFEVATFRRNVRQEELEDGEAEVVGDNYFGSCEEDAKRRDFTINALFYDPIQQKIIDYCDGQKDIANRTLRMIGNSVERFIEDPIRILRAVRLSHKVNFIIDTEMRGAIVQCASELKRAVLPRRREEFLKILRLPDPALTFIELHDLGVLENTLSGLQAIYRDAEKTNVFECHLQRMKNCGFKFEDPTELLSGFMFAFLKAHYGEESWNLNDIQNDDRLQGFLRDELGMFKQEQATFFKALHLIHNLQKVDLYMRKGERRQMGFLRNDALPLALKLAQMDYTITGATLLFWENQFKRFANKPVPTDASEAHQH